VNIVVYSSRISRHLKREHFVRLGDCRVGAGVKNNKRIFVGV